MIETYKTLRRLVKAMPDDEPEEKERKRCKGNCSGGQRCSNFTENPNQYCNKHTAQVPLWLSDQYMKAIKAVKERPYTHNHGDVEIFHEDCSGCKKKQNEDLMESLQPVEET